MKSFIVKLGVELASALTSNVFMLGKRYLRDLAVISIKCATVVGVRSRLFRYGHVHENKASILVGRIDALLMKLASFYILKEENVSGNNILFITSFIAKHGGHTRLLSSFLRHIDDSRILVCGDVTIVDRKPSDSYVNEVVSHLFEDVRENVIVKKCKTNKFSVYLKQFYVVIRKESPGKVVLFNDTADVYLLLASYIVCKHLKIPVAYYHHADDYQGVMKNSFNLHLDMDHNQVAKCHEVNCRHLLRICSPNRLRSKSNKEENEGLTVFSFAPVNAKVVSIGEKKEEDYFWVIKTLLDRGVKVILAVREGEKDLLAKKMGYQQATSKLLVVNENCKDISEYRNEIDVYLDTFDIGGGMSVTDALSIGVPPVINAAEGNQVFRDPVLKEFFCHSSRAVYERVVAYSEDSKYLRRHRYLAEEIYLNYFTEERMAESLMSVFHDRC